MIKLNKIIKFFNQLPDLDAIFANFKSNFFKYLRKNFNIQNNPLGKKTYIPIFFILFIFWFLLGIFIVKPAEKSVVLYFGKYNKTLGPGIHWVPPILSNKYIINVEKIHNFSYRAKMLTKDENIVSVSLATQYRIDNPRDYLFNVMNPSESLKEAVASSLRRIVGHTSLDKVLTIGREDVRKKVKKLLKKILKIYKLGITITDIALLPATAPEEVKASFDDAIKAQEDEQRYVNKAQTYSRRVIPLAEGKAKSIIQKAKAEKCKMILKSQADVYRYLSILPKYLKSPQIIKRKMYLSTMEKIFSRNNKIFSLGNSKNNKNIIFYSLLNKKYPKFHLKKLPKNDRDYIKYFNKYNENNIQKNYIRNIRPMND